MRRETDLIGFSRWHTYCFRYLQALLTDGILELGAQGFEARYLRLRKLNIEEGEIMSFIQRHLVVSLTAFLFGCAAIAPTQASDDDWKLSDALEEALPTLVSSQDDRSASKLYFQLASSRKRLNDTSAACAALARSLAYYRKALSSETGSALYEPAFGEGDDEGMQEIRASFGCTKAQFS